MGLNTVDYDLHGMIGIRLIDADQADVSAVDRQLGPIRAPLPVGPVITVRFVDRLPTGPLSLLGIRDAGYSDEHFLVLRSSHKVPARVAIPLNAVGGSLEIVAEHGLPAVPLLVPIINVTALQIGVLPLHAAAFVYDGRGVVVTGWSKGGKTETLLAFLRHGATYIGDEWVYLKRDGTMHGIPEPIRLWQWHLDQRPDIRRRLPAADRVRLATVAGLTTLVSAAASSNSLARRIRRAVAVQSHADVQVERLGIETSRGARSDLVCLVESWTREETRVEPVSGQTVASKMAHSLHYERQDLARRFYEYRWAFPRLGAPAIEDAQRHEASLLAEVLGRLPAVRCRHPYPVNLETLWHALIPHLEA